MIELFLANWLVYSWLAIKIVITTGIVLSWIPKIGWKSIRADFPLWACIPLMILLAVIPIIGIPLVLILRKVRKNLWKPFY